MNVELRTLRAVAPTNTTRAPIADCDLHLGPRSIRDLYPYLTSRWRNHIETYGMTHRTGYADGAPAFPKSAPMAARRDAWPPDGAPPGSNLEFTRAQHLDAFNIELGLINPPQPSQNFANPDLGNAVSQAMNDWQIEHLVRPEPRLRASVVVNYEDPQAAAAEIERCAAIEGFGHVLLMSRTAEPLGARRYRPIFEAATAADIPVAMHAFGFSGHPATGSGWPSFYLEDMLAHAQAFQSHLSSMVLEGVFQRLPTLKFVMIEGGFGWLPSLCWRLDRLWLRMRSETPHLMRPPSEYIRSQVWSTTQPMEEPQPREHLLDQIGWIGWDRLLFASDYPHWDFDNPDHTLPLPVSGSDQRQF
ncbi:MAG TPA: amidohydrolase family protein, partial [Acetobacteraceae bacterium]|nr:amidohydrolase family protein [Acetobacteraceae bacterium]